MRGLLVSLLISSYFSFCFAGVTEKRLAAADEAAQNGYYSKAISLYELVAFNKTAENKARRKGWYESARLSETKMLDYQKAVRNYGFLIDEGSDSVSTNAAKDRVTALTELIRRYEKASGTLQGIRYKAKMPPSEAQEDIKQLGELIEKYPGYYDLATIYALLANRHLYLSEFHRAYYCCLKAVTLNPSLKLNSPLGRDMEQAGGVVLRPWAFGLAYTLLLISLLSSLSLKPWRFFRRSHLMTGLILLSAWLVFAIVVFNYPRVLGIPTPKNVATPLFVFLDFGFLKSARLWLFLLYSIPALVITYLTVIGLLGRKRRSIHYLMLCANSLIATIASLGLFYLVHCSHNQQQQQGFLYFREEIEERVLEYPDRFPEAVRGEFIDE